MTDDLASAKWFKSSRSGGSKNCVEVAFLPKSLVGVRDSKEPSGPALVFTSDEWSAFVDSAFRGKFDD
ncbi:DUF397 domain-containing protein [Nocardia sp. CA2R105]|uniref:DUF397 domain-containing protein n=1 Tax=Nocardia coffeae TaxID=2873381 RepID=UPI001CA726C7|nr:DUF397 domain-containing protein [Nocardia coffeae]MBY8863322.1 DUF397 domain-containing protein [Nocardia coffeae]